MPTRLSGRVSPLLSYFSIRELNAIYDSVNAELKSKGLLQAKFLESPGVYDAEARPYVVSVDDARELAANHRILIVVCSTVGTVLTTACLAVVFLRHYCPLGDPADDGDEESPGCDGALEHMSQGSIEVIDITDESRGYITPAEQGDAVVRVNFSPDCPGKVEPGAEPETRLEPVSSAHTADDVVSRCLRASFWTILQSQHLQNSLYTALGWSRWSQFRM
jgi:hypothetical protein